MGSEHHVTCLLRVHEAFARNSLPSYHYETLHDTLVPKTFALVWHHSIRRHCRDGPTQQADSQMHTGAARHLSPSAERLSRSQPGSSCTAL
eukprot:6557359-Prymnesium_polylepis.1